MVRAFFKRVPSEITQKECAESGMEIALLERNCVVWERDMFWLGGFKRKKVRKLLIQICEMKYAFGRNPVCGRNEMH